MTDSLVLGPYGVFRLDMDERLALDEEAVG